MSENNQAFIVAISGCSCSGKSTLAELLLYIFPDSVILHQDSFYKTESEVPLNHGQRDWDCPESIDIPRMANVLSYIRTQASFPASFQHNYRSTIGTFTLPSHTIAPLTSRVSSILAATQRLKLIFVDGFLLYGPLMTALQSYFDMKIFLRVSYEKLKARRRQRDNRCAGLDGYWADPPGYVDKVVWPNYVKAYSWLFEHGDINGKFDDYALDLERISALRDKPVDVDILESLNWVVDIILSNIRLRF